MDEDLQKLLDRIRKEGVDKAQSEAQQIIANAQEQARGIVLAAEKEAKVKLEVAEDEAKSFSYRAEEQIRQVARDIKLELKSDLEGLVSSFIASRVTQVMGDGNCVKDLVIRAINAYIKGGDSELELELSGKATAFADEIVAELAKDAATSGIKVKSKTFPNGFSIGLAGGRVQECFSDEAITEALASHVRPKIAELFKRA